MTNPRNFILLWLVAEPPSISTACTSSTVHLRIPQSRSGRDVFAGHLLVFSSKNHRFLYIQSSLQWTRKHIEKHTKNRQSASFLRASHPLPSISRSFRRTWRRRMIRWSLPGSREYDLWGSGWGWLVSENGGFSGYLLNRSSKFNKEHED